MNPGHLTAFALTINILLAGLTFSGCNSSPLRGGNDTSVINSQLRDGHAILANADALVQDSLLRTTRSIADDCRSAGYHKGEGDAYILLGAVLWQRKGKDSARLAFHSAINIFTKEQLLKELATAYSWLANTYDAYNNERDQRIAYYDEAAKFYGLSGLKLEQANTLEQIGDYCMIGNDLLKAQRVLNNAIEIYESLHFPHQQGAYSLLNQVFVNLGNYKKSIEFGRKAVDISKEVNDTSIQACTIYNRLGIPLLYTNQYDSAALVLEKALAIARQYKDGGAQQIVMQNLLDTYIKAKRYKEAISLIETYLSERKDLSREQRNAIHFFALDAYTGIGDHKNGGKYYNALKQSVSPQATDPYELFSYLSMIRFDVDRKDLKAARALMHESETTYRRQNLQNALRWVYRLQFMADSTEGKLAAALASYKQFKDVSDSIFMSSREKQVASLEKQFDAEVALRDQMKEQNIELLRTQGKLQLAEIKQAKVRSYILAGGIVLLVLLMIAGYRVYTQKQKSSSLLEKQKNEIDQQNISLKRLVDQQVRLITEKEWLMKEIHHRVKNNLQIINSLLNFQSKNLTDAAARSAIRNSQNRINAISFIHQRLYKTDSLGYINIENYILELVHYLTEAMGREKKIHFDLEVLPEMIDVARVVPIGLILNEAITNSCKYAFEDQPAPVVHISFDYDGPDHFLFVIADNGKGFPPGFDWSAVQTLGFNILQTMAEQLEAQFSVNGSQGLELSFRFSRVQQNEEVLTQANKTNYA